MAHLQIRSVSPELPRLPRHDRATRGCTPQRDTRREDDDAPPSSSSPVIEVTGKKVRDLMPARRDGHVDKHDDAESCGGRCEESSDVRGSPHVVRGSPTARRPTEAKTPIRPSQHEGIRNPPRLDSGAASGSPAWGELTSSVIKGRAADGLLSLRGSFE